MELAVIFAAFVALGALRPRWTSLLFAVVPAPLACVWLFLHEDIPGDQTGLGDVAWYVGMSLAVGAVCALACAGGVVSGRALRVRRTRLPLRGRRGGAGRSVSPRVRPGRKHN